jgi:alkanesulfonate monooxygenase SsuD/methylene tetrahydromethanopterin reductase-like flavin-dependent oxidoreductase (luciferase family)
MHFGLFCLMTQRQKGKRPADIYRETVEQVRTAEKGGFEIAWFAEHHFSNYCACPSPLMMVARLAGETSRIKLAPGVVVVPLYNPIRLVSEIGMVDALTHGRLVLGIGSGYQPYEFERFGEELENSAPKLVEFVDILEHAFGSETFSHKGQFYELPDTHIAPRPAGGLPDIWIAGDNRTLQGLAARNGWPIMLTPRHASVAQLSEVKTRIGEIYSEQGLDARRAAVAPLRHVCITDSKAEAADFIDNLRHQIRLSQSLRRREELIDGAMLIEKPYQGEPPLDAFSASVLVGDPDTVAERMTGLIRAAEPVHMLLQFQAGDSPLALALRSIERFSSEVVPRIERVLGPLADIGPRAATSAQ